MHSCKVVSSVDCESWAESLEEFWVRRLACRLCTRYTSSALLFHLIIVNIMTNPPTIRDSVCVCVCVCVCVGVGVCVCVCDCECVCVLFTFKAYFTYF